MAAANLQTTPHEESLHQLTARKCAGCHIDGDMGAPVIRFDKTALLSKQLRSDSRLSNEICVRMSLPSYDANSMPADGALTDEEKVLVFKYLKSIDPKFKCQSPLQPTK